MDFDAIVIGSGAAGYSAADWLDRFGVKRVALVTNGRFCGTSRNTGSDKQTYYKISLNSCADSVYEMARDIAGGGSCDGELAFVEAQNSARCFFRLVEEGIDFPTDSYGGFAGYRTDHDNTSRATSIGPKTSQVMVEKLEKAVLGNGRTTVFDNYQVAEIAVKDGSVKGIIALNTESGKIEAISSNYVIAATGAPAGVYSDSVYPVSQHGMTGALIDAGVSMVNFAEWQYGIACVDPRWNLSGSYMQVMPRIFSVDSDSNEFEFLPDGFGSDTAACNMTFRKGYEWPFSAARIESTSRIDLLVKNEADKGRSVFVDYSKNPRGYCFEKLSREAKDYLTAAGAVAETPYERLLNLNPLAEKLFALKGRDLSYEPLKIAVCAQHCNGGCLVNTYFETQINGLFVIGEAAGAFGLTRQGGTALNDTQVSSLRAAEKISHDIARNTDAPGSEIAVPVYSFKKGKSEVKAIAEKMSRCAAFKRDKAEMLVLLGEIRRLKESGISAESLSEYLYDRDTLVCTETLLVSILGTMGKAGSRGGALYHVSGENMPENAEYRKYRAVTDGTEVKFVPVSPVPKPEVNFEMLLKSGTNEI